MGICQIRISDSGRASLGIFLCLLNVLTTALAEAVLAVWLTAQKRWADDSDIYAGAQTDAWRRLLLAAVITTGGVHLLGAKICHDCGYWWTRHRFQSVLLFWVLAVALTCGLSIGAGVVAILAPLRLAATLETKLSDAMDRYRDHLDSKMFFDRLQQRRQCCGIWGYEDWISTPWLRNEDVCHGGRSWAEDDGSLLIKWAPWSCCDPAYDDVCLSAWDHLPHSGSWCPSLRSANSELMKQVPVDSRIEAVRTGVIGENDTEALFSTTPRVFRITPKFDKMKKQTLAFGPPPEVLSAHHSRWKRGADGSVRDSSGTYNIEVSDVVSNEEIGEELNRILINAVSEEEESGRGPDVETLIRGSERLGKHKIAARKGVHHTQLQNLHQSLENGKDMRYSKHVHDNVDEDFNFDLGVTKPGIRSTTEAASPHVHEGLTNLVQDYHSAQAVLTQPSDEEMTGYEGETEVAHLMDSSQTESDIIEAQLKAFHQLALFAKRIFGKENDTIAEDVKVAKQSGVDDANEALRSLESIENSVTGNETEYLSEMLLGSIEVTLEMPTLLSENVSQRKKRRQVVKASGPIAQYAFGEVASPPVEYIYVTTAKFIADNRSSSLSVSHSIDPNAKMTNPAHFRRPGKLTTFTETPSHGGSHPPKPRITTRASGEPSPQAQQLTAHPGQTTLSNTNHSKPTRISASLIISKLLPAEPPSVPYPSSHHLNHEGTEISGESKHNLREKRSPYWIVSRPPVGKKCLHDPREDLPEGPERTRLFFDIKDWMNDYEKNPYHDCQLLMVKAKKIWAAWDKIPGLIKALKSCEVDAVNLFTVERFISGVTTTVKPAPYDQKILDMVEEWQRGDMDLDRAATIVSKVMSYFRRPCERFQKEDCIEFPPKNGKLPYWYLYNYDDDEYTTKVLRPVYNEIEVYRYQRYSGSRRIKFTDFRKFRLEDEVKSLNKLMEERLWRFREKDVGKGNKYDKIFCRVEQEPTDAFFQNGCLDVMKGEVLGMFGPIPILLFLLAGVQLLCAILARLLQSSSDSAAKFGDPRLTTYGCLLGFASRTLPEGDTSGAYREEDELAAGGVKLPQPKARVAHQRPAADAATPAGPRAGRKRRPMKRRGKRRGKRRKKIVKKRGKRRKKRRGRRRKRRQ